MIGRIARRDQEPSGRGQELLRRHPVRSGEKALAGAALADGSAAVGTREALYVGERRIPWESVERADWDAETSTLHVLGVGSWGDPRPTYDLELPDPGRLLQLVRERVTASVVLQRHVAVEGRRGFYVIARRAPTGGNATLTWLYEFDEGIDPEDPEVARLAEAALEVARGEVGD
ncbi:hypothetical protein [Nocardioides donggukensis]|uniref:Uncharacterized protein n=1 Tax=Nocardioides donggukensis TaxID=2774019 RepID=A0A927Q2U2_9ACTN|nr:hypothetical protein [Nocardioides donggukensis]MBD8869971.1 hypothetical protein [Nocardioides donggukensis]